MRACLAVILILALAPISAGAQTARAPFSAVPSLVMLARLVALGGDVTAYTLSPNGAITRALAVACAARRPVTLTLDRPRFDPAVVRENGEALARVGRCPARFAARDLHLKSIVSGDTLYLSDTNFGSDALIVQSRDASVRSMVEQTLSRARAGLPAQTAVLETPTWAFAAIKTSALALELVGLQNAHGGVEIATESFGDSAIARALYALARSGRPVHLLVARREAQTDHAERDVLQILANAGVEIRVDTTDEKELVTDQTCWIGSANASLGPASVQRQPDWGALLRTPDPLCATLQDRFSRTWNAAATYPP